ARTPRATSATCSAAVPVLVAMAAAVPQSRANPASSSRTRAPWVTQPLCITAATASCSAGPRSGRATGTRHPTLGLQRVDEGRGHARDVVAREAHARGQVEAARGERLGDGTPLAGGVGRQRVAGME